MGSLESLLDVLDPDENRRGKQFERIVAWFLTHAPEYETQLRKVWLWDDWPDRPSRDLGIDLVAEARSGALWAIQAKAYAPEYSVTKRDLDSFLAESASRRFSYRLLVATTDRIAANARKTIEHQAIPVGVLLRSDLAASSLNWPDSPSRLAAPKPPKKRLRADQRKAVREVLAGFKTSARGQMIRACGTGKTLTALGVHEQLDAERTLVLVPSLSLLSQTLREWTANARASFEYLAVCSDDTVADSDAPIASTHDLGVPVTTNSNQIATFLRRRGKRVIFSTYQSSPQVAAAYRKQNRPPNLDLAICDEAHRCAGRISSDFATILDAEKIRAKRRLFMTATPRYFTGHVIRVAKESDFEIASMDEEAKFGPVLHRLSFAQAIEQELLSDYRVVIVGVDNATYKSWADRAKFVTRNGQSVTDARTLAGQIGLAKSMRRFDLRRMITFHSRISAARNFSVELPDVIAWMPRNQRPSGTIGAEYVTGTMPTGERNRRLARLAEQQSQSRALLCNVRCLAEGVDVPTLDGVAFIDPRRSEVDIVQAVGRAIRKAENKKIGTVVLPVFVDTEDEPSQVLDQSVFKPVWDVLKALRSHDDELGRELDNLRSERGRLGTSGRLPSKIVIDIPTTVGIEFAQRFEARLVDATTAPWEYFFGLLTAFVARERQARVPQDHIEAGIRLGRWVNSVRNSYAAGQLSAERVARLEALPGWSWDLLTDRWEMNFALLAAFVAREGRARVPRHHVENGVRLRTWVNSQRRSYNKERLGPERVARLEALPGWSWNEIEDNWEDNFALLNAFVAREGHARVMLPHVEDGAPLGKWARTQRRFHKTGRLSAERIACLEALPGWTWDAIGGLWEKRFAVLERFVAREGHPLVPRKHREDGIRLGQWVNLQRTHHTNGVLAVSRAARLESLPGWTWTPIADRWMDSFDLLNEFVAREGHSRVPRGHIENGYRLGAWVSTQRSFYRDGRLSAERAARLEALPGWTWRPDAARWEEAFGQLEEFVKREGHFRVLRGHADNGTQLVSWINAQRQFHKAGRLSAERTARLEALPGWTWRPDAARWEEAFGQLEEFVKREGHFRVPRGHADNGTQLIAWINNQRQFHKAGRLSTERTARLEALPGWTWRVRP